MKKGITLFLLSLLFITPGCKQSKETIVNEYNIVPLPNQMIPQQGRFEISKKVRVITTACTPDVQIIADSLINRLKLTSGITIKQTFENVTDEPVIRFVPQDGMPEEGYKLSVTPQNITLTASTPKGFFYAVQTLYQLLPPVVYGNQKVKNAEWSVPAVEIEDAPRFAYRGLMLDVCRHFSPVEYIYKFIDMLAMHKMNTFHWHLTDDQGWRIEIKKYPKLTEIGSKRKETLVDYYYVNYPQVFDGKEHGGYYTQEQIKAIVDYAASKFITVIPEIEMPGHAIAAIASYPELSCTPDSTCDVTGTWGVFEQVFCPSDTTFQFLEGVMDEVMDLFPSKYIHIGGDECPKISWKECPLCQKRIQEEGLKGTKEHSAEERLQSYFVQRMEKYLAEKHGKKIIGWDEILEGGLSPTATIMWWRTWSPNAVPEATAQGNHAILSPNANFYFDYQQDKNSLPGVYNYNPMLESLSDAQKALILGIQANLWCEYIPSFERAQYMIMPRMMAMAELAWSDPSVKSWDGFKERMVKQFTRLNIMGVNYRIPDLEGFNNTNAFVGEGTLTVTCLDPSAEIHYTTDGSTPTLESPQYKEPVKVTETTDFTFRTFRPNGKKGDIVKTRFIKSEYAPAAEATPSKKGLQAVWHEFRGSACDEIEKAPVNGTYEISEVTIPAEVKGNIGLVVTGYFNAPEDGIYTFNLLSDDGSTLKVDGELVVDNDGPHSPREVVGQKALAKGLHPIEVKYFDHNGGMLQMKVLTADGKELPVNDSLFAF